MEYYDKLGKKTTVDKATYKVQTTDKVAYEHFKRCLKTARRSVVYIKMTPIEWAINQNRNCYGASVAGWV